MDLYREPRVDGREREESRWRAARSVVDRVRARLARFDEGTIANRSVGRSDNRNPPFPTPDRVPSHDSKSRHRHGGAAVRRKYLFLTNKTLRITISVIKNSKRYMYLERARVRPTVGAPRVCVCFRGRRGAREDVGVTHIHAGDVTFGEGLLFDPRARKGSGIDRNQSTLAREGTMVGASSHAREPTPRPPLVSDVATGSVVRSGRSQRTVRLPLGERKASKDS